MAVELTITAPPVHALAAPEWPPQGEWTYEAYKRLPDDGWKYEVIEGELLMAPAPEPAHQESGMNLKNPMWNFVHARDLGKVYDSPIDVTLPGLASPVQPDILFIARDRLHIVKKNAIEGAPDLVVEILSPSNWNIDRQTKFRVYALAGVREYWIVDPKARTIEVYVLRGRSYELLGKYEVGETASSEVLVGFEVKVEEVCPEE